MRAIKFILLFCFLTGFTLFGYSRVNGDLYIHDLIKRILPAHTAAFKAEELQNVPGEKETFELECRNGIIILRGNTNSALSSALGYYLRYYCNTSVSWYASDPVVVPRSLPLFTGKVHKEARCSKRFFLNYCTFGYTMPWWKWKDWERLIDWMALNGINMPLAITGQEAVWYNVWKQIGLSDEEIRSYFTGPAHLPWHRMSNLDHWQGPLPLSWIENQAILQKQILRRERELGMKPVLPAFAGHVPGLLRKKFPRAKISKLSEWGGFEDKYRSFFLDPFDSLFPEIQHAFLKEQTRMFGTDHIYGTDPFNEVKPPSLEPSYLASVAKTIYSSLSAVDSSATWLMMSWIFYFEKDIWTNERIRAFVKEVPQDKLMLLDYYCENTEVWKMTESFYKQPYVWCYLGNFGGNTMLAGNLSETEKRMEYAFANGGAGLTGVGSTLEGLDVNPFMYEYVFEKVWSNGPVDWRTWIEKWAERRSGKENKNAVAAWKLLADSVYAFPARLAQTTLTNARPSFTGHGNWTTDPEINYSNRLLFQVWEELIAGYSSRNNAYDYDLVNTGRQVLGNYFQVLRDSFSDSYQKKDIRSAKVYGKQMLALLKDLDELLSTQHSFLLGKWLNDAKTFGKPAAEKKYFEENARVIITTWGTRGQSLNDYASRNWAGLTTGYYYERWKMFVNQVTLAMEKNKQFDEKAFLRDVTDFEIKWTKKTDFFNPVTTGNSIDAARKLAGKYKSLIRHYP